MNETTYIDKQSIYKNLQALFSKHHPNENSELLLRFIHCIFEVISLEDLQERNVDDLFGIVHSLWNFIHRRENSENKLRVYNPEFELHGWQSTHTVIEVIHDDMPFLVDSLRMEINRQGMLVHWIIHRGCLTFIRNPNGDIVDVNVDQVSNENSAHDAVIYLEIDRQTDPKVLDELKNNIESILSDVRSAVLDWHSMENEVSNTLALLAHYPNNIDADEIQESTDFLQWLLRDNFTFFGSREYELAEENGKQLLKVVPGTGLGILRECEKPLPIRYLTELPDRVREGILSSRILDILQTETHSTIHRPAYTYCVMVKIFDKAGRVVGQKRFFGLYTSASYNKHPRDIPFLRHKVDEVIRRSSLSSRGHAGKALLNVLETLPRDDLFQASVEELFALSMGVFQLQERQRVRLFIREDSYKRFYSCLVFVPREIFNTALRQKYSEIFMHALEGVEITFSTQFSESVLARIHFVVRVEPDSDCHYDVKEIEQKIISASISWTESLKFSLLDILGEALGVRYFNKYRYAFSPGYQDHYSPRAAVADIEHIEKMSGIHSLEMSFHPSFEEFENRFQLKLYRPHLTTPLSDVLPILESMGLRIISERPSKVTLNNKTGIWLNDFDMQYPSEKVIDANQVREIFQEAFSKIWFGEVESDGFNRLILAASLNWKEVSVLRAYSRYLRQLGSSFSQAYVEEIFSTYPDIARKIIELFHARFDPDGKDNRLEQSEKIKEEVIALLEEVVQLDHDRVLRSYLNLIDATLRTNYYQTENDESVKNYISFKFDSSTISSMPLPRPLFEIFVYSPRVEGIHLRAAKVARGGIRWSDRKEDYRTEVLGLMKAQQVKNSIIVPLGAKGGFYPKLTMIDGSRDELIEEVIEAYSTFIRGLLDLTDNVVNERVISPTKVVCYDEEDTYLVVAADKGTATFSDIANAIAEDYNFWLGDAFASGGSTGYDHKKMGITARGAWECVKHHFREMNVDTQTTEFTVVGVGDMAGDVFGNGMLMSPHILLVAAFNHSHIFIDPTPDAAKSFEERQRLFNLPRSNWSDYQAELISKGGGVFSRKAKSLHVSIEIKELLGIEKDFLEPNELLQAILCAEVGLFWNGGIGTFFKATEETNDMVGDRNNDAIRVDANMLRCKVFAEGGNLGATQLGRIEFSRNGGRINTDFIDNSAGVDCSDHEVNIKILLNKIVRDGDLTEKQRNKLMAEMTDEVAELVLQNNFLQTETLSLECFTSIGSIDTYRRYMRELEAEGRLDRDIEFLPSSKLLQQRKAAGEGLARPEYAVLMSYDKILMREEILKSKLPEDPYFTFMLESAFPKPLRVLYPEQLKQHPLRREVIAMQISNMIVSTMGINFVRRLQNETGASIVSVVCAFYITQSLFNISDIWTAIKDLESTVPSKIRFKLMLNVYFLVRRETRWFLRNYKGKISVVKVIKSLSKPLEKLLHIIPEALSEEQKKTIQHSVDKYVALGTPLNLAKKVAEFRYLYSSLDILEAAKVSKCSLNEVAEVYFLLNEHLELGWLREQINRHEVNSHWDELARSSLRDDLDYHQRVLTINLLAYNRKSSKSLSKSVELWLKKHSFFVNRWKAILLDIRSTPTEGYVMYSVALQELIRLSERTLCEG
jgi:glutamate dehydrogenase